MSKTNENNNYIERFHNPAITEHEFVAVLLRLLCKNGINQIDEDKLAEKLYFYYKNKNYKELFQEIYLTNSHLNKDVDISNGLYQEKYYSGCITWETIPSAPLNLEYDPNEDFSFYEEHLSEDGKMKIRKIAEELSVREKIEQQSLKPLYIYGAKPNTTYTLVHGTNNIGDTLSFELLTDGDISFIKYNETNRDHISYESPMYPKVFRTLTDNKVAEVVIKNASFAIKQGLCDNDIRYSKVYTEVVDQEVLKKISDVANERYYNDEFAITKHAPYVRKLSLDKPDNQ